MSDLDILKAVSEELKKRRPSFTTERIKGSNDNDSAILFILKKLLERVSIIKGDSGPRGFRGEIGSAGKNGKNGLNGEKGGKGDKPIPGKDFPIPKDGKDGKDIAIKDIKSDVLKIAHHEVTSHEKAFKHDLIHDPRQLGTVKVDESSIGKDKVLTYNGKKLVYKTPEKVGRTEISSGGVSTFGSRYRIQTVTSDITIDPHNEIILVDASSGNITITLYTAVTNSGRHHFIKRIDDTLGNEVTFATTANQTIDFETLYMLVNRGSGSEIFSDNVNWLLKHT